MWIRFQSVTIKIKVIKKKYFLVVLFKIKATEQYFPEKRLITLYKVVLIFESVDEILQCDHSNESH